MNELEVERVITGEERRQIGKHFDGKVLDRYAFKVIIGAKDLATNSVYIPADIQGIVA